jgi:hypothetical protein
MSEAQRRDGKSPEDEGLPEFDEDLESRRKIPDYDEGMPLLADRPLESWDRVTATEQRRGESLNTRLAREIPDEIRPDRERPGRIYEETENGADVNKELVADEADDVAGLSPEESAMHIVEEDDEL